LTGGRLQKIFSGIERNVKKKIIGAEKPLPQSPAKGSVIDIR